MEEKEVKQLKAFLLSNQFGEDPAGYISKMEHISMMLPLEWNGKFPGATRFKPDTNICKVIESTKERSIIPWWWYLEQKEPVPAVVEDIFKQLVFDYVLVFPKKNVWIYILVEPDIQILELLKNQDNLRAFIMMSIVNKNFNLKERRVNRLRLGKVLRSQEINNIFTFVVFSKNYEFAGKISKQIPSVHHIVDSNHTAWRIYFPGKKQVFWSFKELLANLFGSPIHVKD
ncbi:MAG: hypothetical protein JXB88_11105 [Spirochaetales bacterium]|nr:hypothetical protein [Spirochaetales bacterium]